MMRPVVRRRDHHMFEHAGFLDEGIVVVELDEIMDAPHGNEGLGWNANHRQNQKKTESR